MLKEASVTIPDSLQTSGEPTIAIAEKSVHQPNAVIEEILRGSRRYTIKLWSGDYTDHIDHHDAPYGDHADAHRDVA